MTNLKLKNLKGFTIVELLIVIVIIAILATITIVAYNGITQQAHTAAANQAAKNVADKMDVYNAMEGKYPTAFTDLTSVNQNVPYYLPASAVQFEVPVLPDTEIGQPGTGDPDTRVSVNTCVDGGVTVGLIVSYWDYAKGNIATVETGNTSGTCTTFLPAS